MRSRDTVLGFPLLMAPPRHKTGSPATALALVAAVLVAVSWLLAVVAGAPGPDFGAYADPLEKSLNGQVISTSASYALRVRAFKAHLTAHPAHLPMLTIAAIDPPPPPIPGCSH